MRKTWPLLIQTCSQAIIRGNVLQLTDNGDEKTLREVLAAADSRLERLDSLKVLCQGVEAPLDAPVFEVWKTLRHPDLYVYLVVVNARDETVDA